MLIGWLLLIISIFIRTEAECPPNNYTNPCTCSTYAEKRGEVYDILICSNIHSDEEFYNVIRATNSFEFLELEIIDSSLKSIRHDAFLGTKFRIISIQNSSIGSLSDSALVFEGLQNTLDFIEILNSTLENRWKWMQLSHLMRLGEIHVSDSGFIDVTKGLSAIQHLPIHSFSFQKNGILGLKDGTFAPFINLHRLSLDNNLIPEVKRTMLPTPAPVLTILGLSYNRLTILPSDIFRDMPALKSLHLSGNFLHTIEEDTFRPIWTQLHVLLLDATQISCDCNVAWLAKENKSDKFIHGECQKPRNFKGRFISSLRPDELWCG